VVSTDRTAHATRVTVVVPTRRAARTLAACLRSLQQQTHVPVEIVVVDNHSDDATFAIARSFADRVETLGPERSAQRNAGARWGSGDVVVFIDADMVLEPGVLAQAAAALADESVAAVVIPERSFGVGIWARAKAFEKLLVDGDPAVEGARAVRRCDFEAVGGYDERLDAFEDWDFSDRVVAARGGHLARTRACIWHDEGRLRLRGTYAKKRYYGAMFLRWREHAPPHRLRRRAGKATLRRLLGSPGSALMLCIVKSVEMAGFAVGARAARRTK
jgi:glycosyltransferase involved in cell wall biosynthesis